MQPSTHDAIQTNPLRLINQNQTHPNQTFTPHPSPPKNLPGLGKYSVLAYASLLHAPFFAATGVIGAAVCSGDSKFRRSRLSLAEAAAVPVADSELVEFEAETSWIMVPFLLS
jgi:hypothetical protein